MTIPLALIIGSSTIAHAKDSSPLFHGPMSSKDSECPGGSSRGYLTAYLRADESYDGNAWYFPQNLFAIYTIDRKLFKNVTSQLWADEEIPEVVALPVRPYMVVPRSEKDGYIRLPVAIKAGQRTVLDLDLRQEGIPTRSARNWPLENPRNGQPAQTGVVRGLPNVW
ncbi:MAG: hypothetical protein DMF40_03530 [Verrucomicrobia bacterium]|nr:MAG: hypothetical protein DMF40_03530 [Verrucomicrobiota bacterium]